MHVIDRWTSLCDEPFLSKSDVMYIATEGVASRRTERSILHHPYSGSDSGCIDLLAHLAHLAQGLTGDGAKVVRIQKRVFCKDFPINYQCYTCMYNM